MKWAKRIFLFIAVNFLVIMTISITLSVLGIRPYITSQGIDYGALLAFCSVVGFVGAFVSLALSKWMAKMMMGVQVIDPSHPASPAERQLYLQVQRLAQKAGLPNTPEVGIYNSPEVNAFATGPSKSRALVAVSSGLLDNMDETAVEGVLAHEVSHIANGDMVTMTLIQGIVNTFVMFFARIAAYFLTQAMSGDRDERDRGPSPWAYYLTQYVFEILFSLLGAIVVAWFSRHREFRADKGGAKVAGREKMVHALQSLKRNFEPETEAHPAIASLKINGRKGFISLFATHPDLDSRIEALRSSL
jgi:heat shock protein HtpX